MLFTSYLFLFLFLPVLFLVYFATPGKFRPLLLLLASYLFYGAWRFDYLFLLFGVTSVGFIGGILIPGGDSKRQKLYLFIPLVVLLGVLGWFKYAGFLAGNWNSLSSVFGLPALEIRLPEILLPVGISFFTFQTLSYLVDVYRGTTPCRSFVSFAAYVSLFPQLVAGPIVRYTDISSELADPKVSRESVDAGVVLFMLGFCKKVWIANNVAPCADWVFTLHEPSFLTAWLGALAYTIQIYFDFSGYSEMAIGLGLMFGFTFPENFRFPYLSGNITEFWQRWHITMSSFFRDYVYIPLGGNRKGSLRTLGNLAATMLLAGLWHGAGWTFVLWGAYHGALLAIHRIWRKLRPREVAGRVFAGLVSISVTFLFVVLGWVIFRADSLSAAMSVYAGMAGANGFSDLLLLEGRFDLVFYGVMIVGITAIFLEAGFLKKFQLSKGFRVALFICFVGAVHELGSQGYNPFLYFQF